MKIVVMGYSGSGKSTLTRKLGQHFGCEVLHFDTVQFLPDWEIRSHEEKLQITKEFLDTHDAWVIDGNYSKLYLEQRLEESDVIILMLFNRFSCLYRVTKRYLQYRNKTRPDMGKGCNEKLDLEFIRWVLCDGRKKETKERYQRIKEQYGDKVVVLKNQKELDGWSKRMNIPLGQMVDKKLTNNYN